MNSAYRKNLDVQDDEMECEGKSHGGDEPQVGPRRHRDERLILGQAIITYCFFYHNHNTILLAQTRNSYMRYTRFLPLYLFMAFNISIVTSTERAIVMGWGSEKILQLMPLNSSPPPIHAKWWVCVYRIVKDWIAIRNEKKYISFCKSKTDHVWI